MADPVLFDVYGSALTWGGGHVPWTGSISISSLNLASGLTAQWRFNDTGSWSCTYLVKVAALPWTESTYLDPTFTLVNSEIIPTGTIVQFGAETWDTFVGDLFVGVVEQVTVDWVNAEEVAKVTISGRTWGAFLDWITIFPYGGVDSKPFTDSRAFSWASPEYDDTGWAQAKELTDQQTGSIAWTLDNGHVAPDSWPDGPTAQWIWADNPGGGTSTATDADIGTCLFRRTWNNSTPDRFAFFVTADNYYVLYLDGIEIASNREDPQGWQSTTRFDCDVSAGTHIIGALVENVAGSGLNPGGLLVIVKQVNPDGTLTDFSAPGGAGGNLDLWSNDGWLVMPYVTAPYPGLTPGRIMQIVMDEALARDTDNTSPIRARYPIPSWDETSDTAGATWDPAPEIVVSVGSTGLDLIRQLHEQAGVLWTDGSTGSGETANQLRDVHMWKPATTIGGSPVAYTVGTTILTLRYNTEA